MTQEKLAVGWTIALAGFKVGDVLLERYRLARVEPARMIWERIATGKTEAVTAGILNRCWNATANGGTLLRRANGPAGISYTVLVEEVVVKGLGLKLNEERKWTR